MVSSHLFDSDMFRRISIVAITMAALTACRSDSTLQADVPTVSDTLTAYALTGTQVGFPNGLNSVFGTTVRIDGTANFDVAFDFTDPEQIQVIPARSIVSAITGAPAVGLMTVEQPFDSLRRAPDGYYRPDTAITVSPGQTFVMQSFRNSGLTICYYLVTPRVYSKVVIDSVNVTTRAVYIRQTVNPNCGYRSFLPGFPKD
jgi:hypothetical protein